MYQLVDALVRENGKNGRWKKATLSNVKVNDIYSLYRHCYLILTNNFIQGELSLNMEDVRVEYGDSQLTISEWLGSLGTTALPTLSGIPKIEAKTVKYSDAWLAGYDVQLADNFAHPDSNLPNSEKEDVILSKEGVDYSLFYQHCLVSVNGLIHLTNQSVHGIYVVDGGITGRRVGDNRVGILSFLDVAPISFIRVTDSMIYKQNPMQKLHESAYIDLGVSMEGKTLLMVLGGFLHVMDDAYKVIGDKCVKIDFNNLNLVQRYFDTCKQLDLSSLGLTTTSRNDEQIATSELYSDEAIKAYLKLSQTFFVVVNTNELYVERHAVGVAQLAGRYYTGKKPNLPLIANLGRMTEYWPMEDRGRNVLGCKDYLSQNYHFETTKFKDDFSIAPHRVSAKPFEYANAHLLEIGKEFSI